MGLIPAHAGKTGPPRRRFQSGWAHPRSRGENVSGGDGRRGRGGSSPLTREKLGHCDVIPRLQGLIPARAGKTRRSERTIAASAAHPRSRGENNLSEDDSSFWRGSSPLARGKRAATESTRAIARLIPARAGKTARWPRRRRRPQAHPRSRGENTLTLSRLPMSVGSSPLARGKPLMPWQRQVADGLIPARAGKTARKAGESEDDRAHPRSRGENSSQISLPKTLPGSSPLARGKRSRYSSSSGRPRLIPARAGKTQVDNKPTTTY